MLYYNKKNPVELKHRETSSSCRVFYLMKLKPENMTTSHEKRGLGVSKKPHSTYGASLAIVVPFYHSLVEEEERSHH